MKIIAAVFALLILSGTARAQSSEYWNLPAVIADSNGTIGFEVDSTWHLVHGSTKGISGKAWLADSSDYRSVKAELHLPVARFDTDNSSRDKKMRKVMQSDTFPEVVFFIEKLSEACDPRSLQLDASCNILIDGKLKIRDVLRPLVFKATALHSDKGYQVHGSTAFKWADFGVEDPSIFIAKLDETVVVRFTVLLPDQVPADEFKMEQNG
ncbi:MAG: YceI family protein [Deltaproteobacteria bacterium]|nr:YceI family protein [Deltaproteobacteria bacterium]